MKALSLPLPMNDFQKNIYEALVIAPANESYHYRIKTSKPERVVVSAIAKAIALPWHGFGVKKA